MQRRLSLHCLETSGKCCHIFCGRLHKTICHGKPVMWLKIFERKPATLYAKKSRIQFEIMEEWVFRFFSAKSEVKRSWSHATSDKLRLVMKLVGTFSQLYCKLIFCRKQLHTAQTRRHICRVSTSPHSSCITFACLFTGRYVLSFAFENSRCTSCLINRYIWQYSNTHIFCNSKRRKILLHCRIFVLN